MSGRPRSRCDRAARWPVRSRPSSPGASVRRSTSSCWARWCRSAATRRWPIWAGSSWSASLPGLCGRPCTCSSSPHGRRGCASSSTGRWSFSSSETCRSSPWPSAGRPEMRTSEHDKPRVRLPLWRRLGWRLSASILLLTALGILVSGLLQYRAQEQWVRQSLGSLLLNIARTGALLVDGELHQKVVRQGRTDTPEYTGVWAQLRRVQEANQLADAVYTLSDIEGDTAKFAVVSKLGRDGKDFVPVGLGYKLAPEIQPVLRQVLATGTPAYTGIYERSSGTWITAFAPVRDASLKPVAVLDVDFRADVYLAQLRAVKRRLYLHSLVAALLAVGAGILIARQITRPVAQLAAGARRVVEGDLGAPVQVSARDEIGLLGNVFHLMVDRLRVSHRSMVDVLVRALESRVGEPGSLGRLARASRALSFTTSARSGPLKRCCGSRVRSQLRSGS